MYSNMEGLRGYHAKWSKSQKETCCHLNVGSKEMLQVNLFTKQK